MAKKKAAKKKATKKKPYRTPEEQKADFQRAGLVKPPGGEADSLHWKCYECKCIVFWRLLTMVDARKYRCVWCEMKGSK